MVQFYDLHVYIYGTVGTYVMAGSMFMFILAYPLPLCQELCNYVISVTFVSIDSFTLYTDLLCLGYVNDPHLINYHYITHI